MNRTRRRLLQHAGLMLAARAFRPYAAVAQPPMPLRELRGGVGLFAGAGGTIGWLATPDGMLVVDSQFPATAQPCIAALRSRATSPIEALINTHHHGDHTAGNVTFRPVVTRIVQHERCAAAHRALTQAQGPEAQRARADVTFTDAWSTTIGGERVSAVHFGAAHTAGDAAVVFERANVVHLGDLVFNRIPPFIDRAAGGSILNWVTVLERIATRYADALFVFGHGKDDALTGSVRDVTHFRDYLASALDHVREGIAAGRSPDEIAAVASLPGFTAHADAVKNYASAIPQFTLRHVLTVAYQELTGATP